VVVCGVFLVVSCFVLFLLCVCVRVRGDAAYADCGEERDY